jgi:hypothetical protein
MFFVVMNPLLRVCDSETSVGHAYVGSGERTNCMYKKQKILTFERALVCWHSSWLRVR